MILRYITIIFCSFSFLSLAQGTGSIEGTVFSESEGLAGVHIHIVGTPLKTISSDEGKFNFDDLQPNRYTLVFSREGMLSDTLKLELKEDEKKKVRMDMFLDITFFDEIEIVSYEVGLTQRTPYNIRKLDARDINLKGSPSGVMGILTQEPGVNAADMGHGISKPFIRGLGFSRIVTLYQGNKLENHQWGADHGLGLNDLGIGSVDVIKGPASILYGSGALGGVIILNDDLSYLDSNGVTGLIGTTFNSVSLGLRTYASVGNRFDNGVFVAFDAAVENHADYLNGDGRIIGNSRFNTRTLRLHAGVDRENFRGKLSYSFNDQNLGIIGDDEMENSMATFRSDRTLQLPFQRVTDHVLSYSQRYEITEQWRTELDVSHHFNFRNEIETDLDSIDLGLRQNHTFYNLRATYSGIDYLTHTWGIQGSHIMMENSEQALEILIPNASYFENGLFYLGTFTKNKHTIQGGLRFDYRTITADANQENIIEQGYILPGDPTDRTLTREISGFTGSIGYTFKPNFNNLLKLNFSSGYRAPDLAELFSNGNHPGTSRFEKGNADFGREQSYQADASWLYKNKKIRLELSFFGNVVRDYLFFADSGDTTQTGLNIWEFMQQDVFISGGEFSLNYKPFENEKLVTVFRGNIIRGTVLDSEENLTFIPADRFYFELRSKPWDNYPLSIYAGMNNVFAQNRPGFNEESTPGYELLEAGVNYPFSFKKQKLEVALTVKNLLDETYVDHISIMRTFNVSHPGRNFMINLRWSF
ncbi:MAG: TonB-dependent receptor [Brumimicrobium sp.]|nr:TonB-dependent receptor [Brumimicrobium sp.]